jgi:predicted lipoprotein with Yx(FWY)xxD motif
MLSRTPFTLMASAAVIPLTALALASCGGDNGNSATASSPPPKTASGKSATLGVESTSLGKILDNGQGRTLYVFQADSGTKSNCSGACATNWPPLTSANPTVGKGANASMVGTSKRSDGKTQVTYNGHPLYTFQGDSGPGDTSGQGVNAFGGLWYALSPSGQQVTASASNNSGGGSGSIY